MSISYTSTLLVASFAFLLAPAPAAQTYEDPGPHPGGWSNVSFLDSGGATLTGRVYYPALSAGQDAPPDPAQGPYPMMGLTHGLASTYEAYDELSTHLASWGFVVTSLGASISSPPLLADDTAELMQWTDGQSDDPASFLFGMISDDAWSAMGHSLGGGALQYLVDDLPDLGAILSLQPSFLAAPTTKAYLAAFQGSVLAVAGSEDLINPPTVDVYPFFQTAENARRNVYVEVLGMGHFGPLDDPPGGSTLSFAEQHRLHRKLTTAFLVAEIKGVENAWLDLLGEGLDFEPVVRESACQDPPLWVLESQVVPGSLVVGLGGKPDGNAKLGLSKATASIPTHVGVIGLDPAQIAVLFDGSLGGGGWTEVHVAIPPGVSGQTVWLQGFVAHSVGAALSRTAAFTAP